ncbi:neuritin-like [Sphaeramia orbicularis]|uniref:neuritin-like n=1 Tax=Sphaeramia orbicularis TaxID=375764 RepID=UPI0011801CB7|nr:neuritin [Sphaeramia orbicularis]
MDEKTAVSSYTSRRVSLRLTGWNRTLFLSSPKTINQSASLCRLTNHGAPPMARPRRDEAGDPWAERRLLWEPIHDTVLVSAGQCDSVFKGFSDCLLKLGDNMANYPQDLDDTENLHKICSYWDNFHSCATTALADCQEGATDLWEKLKKESRNLDFRGSLFELCGGSNGAPRSAGAGGVAVLLASLPTILTWLAF